MHAYRRIIAARKTTLTIFGILLLVAFGVDIFIAPIQSVIKYPYEPNRPLLNISITMSGFGDSTKYIISPDRSVTITHISSIEGTRTYNKILNNDKFESLLRTSSLFRPMEISTSPCGMNCVPDSLHYTTVVSENFISNTFSCGGEIRIVDWWRNRYCYQFVHAVTKILREI
jgi:hypothetical protein